MDLQDCHCPLPPKNKQENKQIHKPDLDIEDGGNVDMNDLMGQIC